jgi:hypothetical protein
MIIILLRGNSTADAWIDLNAATYLKVVASTLPKDLHVGNEGTSDPRELSDEDLTAIVLNG